MISSKQYMALAPEPDEGMQKPHPQVTQGAHEKRDLTVIPKDKPQLSLSPTGVFDVTVTSV